MIRWLARIALFLTLAVMAGVAQADELRPGYLELVQRSPQDWRVVWKAPVRGGMASNARPSLPAICTASVPQRRLVAAALVEVSELRCTAPLAGQKVGLSGLDSSVSDALVRIAPLGQPVQAARLTADAPMAEVAAKPQRMQVAKTYVWLGVEHILTGYDHLLFVLALVLLLSGGWAIARAVTAFTVAHSITLVATTLQLISLPRQPVEICIALSIMFLAVEIVKVQPGAPRLSERLPWLVAFAFGLLHGFGFAGALAEIGLPQGEIPVALLSFNLGVEAGQLIIVAISLAILAAIRRFAAATLRPVKFAAAYGIGSLASFWTIERMLA